MSNVITYTSDDTSKAVDYVSAIVFNARAKAQERLAAEHTEERERAEREATRAAQMLEIARAGLPETLRAFVEVENVGWSNYRAVITLPGCAPFKVDIHADRLTSYFYPAICYDGSDDYKPSLQVSTGATSSDIDTEIARAYEAEAKYAAAIDAWEHAQAEREHADEMSTRESKLRHDEEPEPDTLPFSSQPAKLFYCSDEKALSLIDEYIAAADESLIVEMLEPAQSADYYLKRANAISNYLNARINARRWHESRSDD